uniref:Uncharacterized protein n=1 Tax=Panagrolaimus superbus TaxID=310955 RepID=A0A914YE44_9BILA
MDFPGILCEEVGVTCDPKISFVSPQALFENVSDMKGGGSYMEGPPRPSAARQNIEHEEIVKLGPLHMEYKDDVDGKEHECSRFNVNKSFNKADGQLMDMNIEVHQECDAVNAQGIYKRCVTCCLPTFAPESLAELNDDAKCVDMVNMIGRNDILNAFDENEQFEGFANGGRRRVVETPAVESQDDDIRPLVNVRTQVQNYTLAAAEAYQNLKDMVDTANEDFKNMNHAKKMISADLIQSCMVIVYPRCKRRMY